MQYDYDAWGNLIRRTVQSGDSDSANYKIAEDNPFRYRGYYYDRETGFYYLQSRYYDPVTGRFINASGEIGGELLGNNQYAYCANNSVMNKQGTVSEESLITTLSLSENGVDGITNSSIFSSTSVFSSVGESSSILNSTLVSGSFRNGLFFSSGSITGLYVDWNARAQFSFKKGKFVLGAFSKFSILNGSGQIGFGTDELNISLKVVGDVGTVTGMAGIIIDPQKEIYFVGFEAKAVALSGRVGSQIEIFGIQIEVGVSGEIGSVGGRLGIGYQQGEINFGGGFALGIGWDIYIRIRFDDLFG